jgi:flagellar protein FlaG
MTIDSAATTVVMPGFWPVPPTAGKSVQQTPTEPVSQIDQQEAARPQPTVDEVKSAVKQIEAFLKASGRSLQFKLDDASGHMVISVLDAESGDLIRQIPGEDALRIARALADGSQSLMQIVA